jgi:uncharacterized protein (TIGR03067 family)
MKNHVVILAAIVGLAGAIVIPAKGQDLPALAGKWTVQKTNDSGEKYTQQIEIKKDKFTFKISEPGGDTRLYAEGDVKLDKAGPFKSIAFTNIKAGSSSDDTNPIDDTYTSIYKLGDDDTWLVVMNFDKDRDSQKPSLDVYRKVKQAQK